MSKLLINESPLQVQPSLAKAIGLHEAIFLQQLHYWMGASRFVRDERKWVYNSYDEWLDQLKYLSLPTLKRAIKSLKDQNLLRVERFDKLRSNQVNYYSINYDVLLEIENKFNQVADSIDEVNVIQCSSSSCTNALDQDEPMEQLKMSQSPVAQDEPMYTREYQETTQEITKKKNKKKTPDSFDAKSAELPSNVNPILWNDFVDMRNGLKKPLTENAVKLVLKKLAGFGQLADQALETSIIGNYTGIYPPKQPTQSQQQQAPVGTRFGNMASQNQSPIRDIWEGYSNA